MCLSQQQLTRVLCRMSWALDDWKAGLPGRALQRVQELESQLEKLLKERQQRQFQLEAVEGALLQQKHKVGVGGQDSDNIIIIIIINLRLFDSE